MNCVLMAVLQADCRSIIFMVSTDLLRRLYSWICETSIHCRVMGLFATAAVLILVLVQLEFHIGLIAFSHVSRCHFVRIWPWWCIRWVAHLIVEREIQMSRNILPFELHVHRPGAEVHFALDLMLDDAHTQALRSSFVARALFKC